MADSTERNSDPNAEEAFAPGSRTEPDDPITQEDALKPVNADASDAVPEVVGEERLAENDEERAAREAEEELLWIFQATVFDNAGQKIGRVGQVYLDDQTQKPNWVTVKTGLFGMKEFFVPLDDSERSERRITVPFDKATVLASPRTEVDQNLSPEEEDALYSHYGVEGKMSHVGEEHSVGEPHTIPEPPQSNADFDALIDEGAASAERDTAPVQEVSPDEAFANPDASSPNPFENPDTANEPDHRN